MLIIGEIWPFFKLKISAITCGGKFLSVAKIGFGYCPPLPLVELSCEYCPAKTAKFPPLITCL